MRAGCREFFQLERVVTPDQSNLFTIVHILAGFGHACYAEWPYSISIEPNEHLKLIRYEQGKNERRVFASEKQRFEVIVEENEIRVHFS